ncbi:peptidyl-tRNA hydrolase 2, mitochondrial-like isoform X1 [Leptopilina boulardi]|uniref:peptidyl-tRNA hydrolase 2, mitochondrial-like isoform X1 n=1 Tax=Leptopilina boulardi TaxID=63433 RepID=UPI0021F533FD|nr:peptidyl-tRNA hydrolase 2, mitochondrial-like isoform X1 [Leptopilina boulardi]
MSLMINKIKSLLSNRIQSVLNCKMVIVVRTDIPMGRGKIAAQCAHAAVQCCQEVNSSKTHKLAFNSWLLVGQPKIILQISNEKSLLNLANEAKKIGLPFAIIRDAGRTQLEPGTISVLGIGPAPKEHVDKITSSLKLL